MHDLKIKRTFTREEKGAMVLHLTERTRIIPKVQKAFGLLFGELPPEQILINLSCFNSRTLTGSVNRNLLALLGTRGVTSGPLNSGIDSGILLNHWIHTHGKNHPHHLVPRSRGGTNAKRNIWLAGDPIHQSFHAVFHNLTPYEQLALVINKYKSLLDIGFIRELEGIQAHYPEPHCYKQGVVDTDRYS